MFLGHFKIFQEFLKKFKIFKTFLGILRNQFFNLLQESYSDGTIVECDGPVMIIICLDSLAVGSVEGRCKALLPKYYSCVAYVEHGTEEIQVIFKRVRSFQSLLIFVWFRLQEQNVKWRRHINHNDSMLAAANEEPTAILQ